MIRTLGILRPISLMLLVSASVANAQEIKPADDQTSVKWGNVSEENGARKVASTEAEYHAHNRHGPITFDHVSFTNGTFSLSWKRDLPQKMSLVFEAEKNGEPVHLFKVFINGAPNKDTAKNDVISLVTCKSIAGSNKKKAAVTTEKHHAEAGKWHKQASNLTMMWRPFVLMMRHSLLRTTDSRVTSSNALLSTHGELSERKT